MVDPIQSDNIAYDSLLEAAKENLLDLNFTKRTNELIQLSIKYGGLYHQASFF